MAESLDQYLEITTRNAEAWLAYMEQVRADYSTGGQKEDDKYALAFSRCQKEIMTILMEELNDAIGNSDEYTHQKLADRLRQVFNNPAIIVVTKDKSGIDIAAEAVAGSADDFWDGVRYARDLITAESSSGKRLPTKARRAWFWKKFVYEGGSGETQEGDEELKGDLYEKTLAWRFEGWKGLAPYWIWLNYGTTSRYAYPHNKPTKFVEKTKKRGSAVFKRTLSQVEVEAEELIESAMDDFIKDPATYSVFDVLDDFFYAGRPYVVYVTKTSKVGIALRSTYLARVRTGR